MREREITITDADVHFVEKARDHYRVFAETCEESGKRHSAGLFRKQEFYAERFLLRLRKEAQGE